MSRERKKPDWREVTKLIIGVAGVFLTINLVRNIIELSGGIREIRRAQEELRRVTEENRVLRQKAEYYKSAEFIEQEARDKLNMIRPGESVILTPADSGEPGVRPTPALLTPNWKKWVEVFF